jgi:hypothetical protein
MIGPITIEQYKAEMLATMEYGYRTCRAGIRLKIAQKIMSDAIDQGIVESLIQSGAKRPASSDV